MPPRRWLSSNELKFRTPWTHVTFLPSRVNVAPRTLQKVMSRTSLAIICCFHRILPTNVPIPFKAYRGSLHHPTTCQHRFHALPRRLPFCRAKSLLPLTRIRVWSLLRLPRATPRLWTRLRAVVCSGRSHVELGRNMRGRDRSRRRRLRSDPGNLPVPLEGALARLAVSRSPNRPKCLLPRHKDSIQSCNGC
jgi:hypothetical protein